MKKKDDFKNFFIGFICVFVFGLAIIPFEYMSVYMFVVFLFVIFCADDSGIRMRLGKRLSRDFPLRRLFSKNRQKPDIRTEYYKTFTFLSLLLMIPFQKRWYYTKEMEGSYSIKYVLPALFPNEPDLDYHNLPVVHNGDEASSVFEALGEKTKEEQEIIRDGLLKYCKLDTLAMVKVWEKLKEV